jgi:hypothetical protein
VRPAQAHTMSFAFPNIPASCKIVAAMLSRNQARYGAQRCAFTR